MTKKTNVVFGDEARKELFVGIDIVARAVGTTLGPKGKTVVIQQRDGRAPIVTKDGVTVAKTINFDDPLHKLGGQLIREAADKTNDAAGDGTTTSTVLTHAMIAESMKLLSSGHSSRELCKGIESAVFAITSYLKSIAVKVDTQDVLTQVATVSSNNDKEIGQLISAAFAAVGSDGVVTVEDARGTSTTMEVVEGLTLDRGYLSPYFVTDNEKMQASHVDAKILVCDKKINDIREIIPLLEKILDCRAPLLVIADDVEGDAMQGLVLNRLKTNLPVVAIKAPGFGSSREELLGDLCALTGAKLVSAKTGLSLKDVTIKDLGRAKRIIVDAKSTTIVGGMGNDLQSRIEELKIRAQDVTTDPELILSLKERAAKLSRGIAVIRVGGVTELDSSEKKFRIEDALNATKAASEEGILPGGGIALFRASEECHAPTDLSSDEREGWNLVLKSCLAPIKKIVDNASLSSDVVLNELKKRKTSIGVNAATGEYVDTVTTGIIDPLKVCRLALKNAASVASVFVGLDAVIVDNLKVRKTDDDR